MKHASIGLLVGLALTGLMPAGALAAIVNTWTNQGTTVTNDWFVDGNWSQGHFPQAEEDVVITNAGVWVILSNSVPASGWLSSLTISNTATLIFTNWTTALSATNIAVLNKGTITCIGPFTTNDGATNRVYLVCSNLFIGTNAAIDVSRKGYQGGATVGYGPGGATTSRGGGSYGGRGRQSGTDVGAAGATYGLADSPVEPGSGSRADSAAGAAAGGGAVRIVAAGSVVVNGRITASGGDGLSNAGSGSGGGIYISCMVFGGTNGLVLANGGYGQGVGTTAGGGGGRIAIDYHSSAQSNQPLPAVQVAATQGNDAKGSPGEIGTLYFPDTQWLTEMISTNGVCNGQLVIPGFTNWAPNALTISNVWIRFPVEGFRLAVTNDLMVYGASGRLDVCGSKYTNTTAFDHLYNETNGAMVLVGGNLALTNGGRLYVYSAPTNTAGAYGALVSVTNDVLIANNSWIYSFSHPTNGGSALFRMRSLLIASSTNGGMNANASGFMGGLNASGFGPGGGNVQRGGGAYGGVGRQSIGGGGSGVTYGAADAPLDPGSGGKADTGSTGGRGGGLVRIQATNAVVVNGVITANGGSVGGNAGGGSGGGIYITCKTFAGVNGLVSAAGGSGGTPTVSGGGGGGGRIAICYSQPDQTNQPTPSVRFTAAGGDGNRGYYGEIGTLYFPDNLFLTETIPHSGQWIVPGFTNWEPGSLTISNSYFRFRSEGFHLTVGGDVRVDGPLACLDLGMSQWTNYTVFNFNSNPTNGPIFTVAGNLLLTNGGSLVVFSGMTNTPPPDYGALVNVAGNMVLSSNSWVYPYSHPINGGSVLFHVRSLTFLSTNSGFDASSRGYAGGYNSGGYGPGAAAGSRAGGGYGGQGKTPGNVAGGVTYGSSNAPILAGSGGAADTGSVGAKGGGSIRIDADVTVTMGGIIRADGGIAGLNAGGGSGGSIFITCRKFMGSASGVLSANGGNGNSSVNSGVGGGGRIAVWSVRDSSQTLVSTYVMGGTNGGTSTADSGSLYSGWVPAPGTVIQLR